MGDRAGAGMNLCRQCQQERPAHLFRVQIKGGKRYPRRVCRFCEAREQAARDKGKRLKTKGDCTPLLPVCDQMQFCGIVATAAKAS